MKKIIIPLMLIGTVSQSDIGLGISVISGLHHISSHHGNRPIYRDDDFNNDYSERGAIRAFNRNAIQTYKVYDDLVSYASPTSTTTSKKYKVIRKFVQPTPKENTVVSSSTKEVCDDNGQCNSSVTTVTDRVRTEIIR